MKAPNQYAVKTGDKVLIHFEHNRLEPAFEAIVGETVYDLGQGLKFYYERVDGIPPHPLIGKHMCNASHVVKIIEPAPYVTGQRVVENIFATCRDLKFARIEKDGGLMKGWFKDLVVLALSKVTHVPLSYWLHEERLEALYEKHKKPGFIRTEEDEWGRIYDVVRWKTFKAWIRRNAWRLVASKQEALREAVEAERKAWEQTADDFSSIVDRYYGVSAKRDEYDEELDGYNMWDRWDAVDESNRLDSTL